MLSKRYYTNTRSNDLTWTLDDLLGHGFENHIANVLKRQLIPYYDSGVSIFQTKRTRDDGKDIIISSTIDLLNIMETNFYIENLDIMKIYIECKSTNNGPISYNEIIGNIDRINDGNVKYFVLVTNTTIVPYTYYMLENKCKQQNIKFILLDQHVLCKYLTNQNSMIGNIKTTNNDDDIYIEYQTLTYENNYQKKCEIYLLLRNYKNTTEKIDINLISNRNWEETDKSLLTVILPNQCSCIKLNVVKKFSDGVDELNFLIKTKDFERVVDISGIKLLKSFEPDFWGKQHNNLVNMLCELIYSEKYSVRYLIGEAGTGKTRIIDEIQKNFLEQTHLF